MRKILDSSGTNDFELPQVVFPDVDHESGSTFGYWRWTPSPPSPVNDVVWHYTDPQGIIGILENRQVWATSMVSLNDHEEFGYGMSVLKQCLDHALESRYIHPDQKTFMRGIFEKVNETYSLRNLFVFCASEENDILNQWRNYGGEVSYALGIPAGMRLPMVSEATRETQYTERSLPTFDNKSSYDQRLCEYEITRDFERRAGRSEYDLEPKWGRVLYDIEEQKNLLNYGLSHCATSTPIKNSQTDSAVGDSNIRDSTQVLAQLVAFCKHPSFADEKEVRVVVAASPGEGVIDFRATRFGVTPFVRLAHGSSDNSVAYRFFKNEGEEARLIVKGVSVGPTPHRSAAVSGMELLMEDLKIENIDVIESRTPFR